MYSKSGSIFIVLLILLPTVVIDGRCIRYCIKHKDGKKYFVFEDKWFDDFEEMKNYAFGKSVESTTQTTTIATTLKPTKRIEINAEKLNQNFLKQTNRFRKMHKAKPLTFSPEAAKAAQAFAEKCAEKNEELYDDDETYNTSTDELPINEFKNAIKKWYEEEKLYNYNYDSFDTPTRHFSLMVWQTLQQMGCGFAQGTQKVYVVCKYGPHTQLEIDFKKNVLKKD